MLSRRFSNQFFRNQDRLFEDFMRDFDDQLSQMDLDWDFPSYRFFSRPIRSFNLDQFFRPIEQTETAEQRSIRENYEKEFNQLRQKYQQNLLELENKSKQQQGQQGQIGQGQQQQVQQQEGQQKKEMEIEPESENFVYEYQQFKEMKDGKETGKQVETKEKKVGKNKVKEIKTTILNEDGTKDVIERIEDEKGVSEKKHRYGKDDKLLSIE